MIFMGMLISLVQSEQIPDKETELFQNCIACHLQEQVPSELIYRRYLMRYSSHKTIKEVMFDYLKQPSIDKTIMPKQFFMKFPQKEPSDLDENLLLKGIEAYLEFYDIKKRLEVPTS
jgi:hypothetical protein